MNHLIEYLADGTQAKRMSEEKRQGAKDYTEVEFEFGDLEFEAKGKSVVIERMFRLLLEKLEEGKLTIGPRVEEEEEE